MKWPVSMEDGREMMSDLLSLLDSLDDRLRRVIYFAIMLILALLADLVARRVILGTLRKIVGRTTTTWDDLLMQRGVFRRLARYAPAAVIHFLLPLVIPPGSVLLFFQRLVLAYMIAISMFFLNSLLDGIHAIYRSYEVSKSRPIKSFMQLINLLVYVTGIVLMGTTIAGVSPLGILSGIGALSAVLLLVFKDSILGLISSIQLSANKQVRIGDWVEVPQFGADGDVIEITLQSVMVRNWDKTIVTLPTYALTTSSFKNWRGMSESGGRRIKRSITIDMRSIRFLNDDDLRELEQIPLLADYLKQKRQELEEHNRPGSMLHRRLTNIGTFRAYIRAYLEAHPQIHASTEMTFLVRQLPPGPEGLPIELYVFSRNQDWAAYEGIQADIFDHLLSILPEFSLLTYQHPGTVDFQGIARSLEKIKKWQ